MYRVQYEHCDRPDYDARMEREAQEKVNLHQDLWHHHDGQDCAHYEEIDETLADQMEAITA